ncbi:hypothetical protein [Algoriphagus sp.]|uniref:hypothetical protein n=1 Tax=Algoriphagus sp. TaxID=1872435 RepID=UPI0025DDBDC1|nr:hypothetical protein [Algoriphagus sp.]
MKPFPKLHLWFLLPFFITLLGFQGYWLGFSTSPFHWHLHGLSATFWYICLIIQPWLYHNRPIQVHKKVGMLSLILAGFVIASSINMIVVSLHSMSDSSPLYSVRYSLALFDLTSICGFTLSVVLAIIYARNIQIHARWMISTVFWVLAPGTVRFSFIPLFLILQPKEFSDFPFEWADVFIWNLVLIILIILFLMIKDYIKLKKIYFSYLLILITNLIFIFIFNDIKDAAWLKSFFD